MGITVAARIIAVIYSIRLRFAKLNTFLKKSISITARVKIKEIPPAPISQRFIVFILKIEPFSDLILKEWNISAHESVKNASDVPTTFAEY
jgi:hypothetical protein